MKLKPQVEQLLFIDKNPVLSIIFFQIDWKICKTSFKLYLFNRICTLIRMWDYPTSYAISMQYIIDWLMIRVNSHWIVQCNKKK